MKKAISIMIFVCTLLLYGCAFAQNLVPPATAEVSTQPPMTEDSTPTIPTAAPTTPPTESEPPVTTPTETEPPEPSQPEYPYGDTTPTWSLGLASQYPPDEECSPELLLEKWLCVEGLTLCDLEERDCSQLLLTVALTTDGVETTNICYERQEDGSWCNVPELSWLPGHVAKYGIAHNRVIDSYTSPAGLWALGMAFGNEEAPAGLLLPWRDVTDQSDWVCDTKSPYFNTWQERDDPDLEETWDYDAGEHLADYPYSYAYACVIAYNLPPDSVPSRGCAIFLHCGDDYTAGCVSLPEPDLLQTLLWLDPDKNPHILITGNPQG